MSILKRRRSEISSDEPRVFPDLTPWTDDYRALASRYSGRYPGYPFVRFWGIWNESNLGGFLAPQFNAQGKIVGPALYAKLAAAGYAGIKSGSKKALVAIGETSSHGLDKKPLIRAPERCSARCGSGICSRPTTCRSPFPIPALHHPDTSARAASLARLA